METGQAAQQAKNKVEEVKGAVKNEASHLANVAADAGHAAVQKVGEVASNVGQKVQDVASKTVDKADKAIAGVGDRMTATADSLRNVAPHEGVLGSAAGSVADNLKASGQYLQEHGVEDMMKDVSGVISRNPLPSIFIALGAGFLLGAALRRS
jgi:ElaB/YqjD/DUF883 family membrane-anchored ribosome-binding protein